MAKQLITLDIAVIVFGANLVVSLLWYFNTPGAGGIKTAIGSTFFVFLTLFLVTSFIRLKKMSVKNEDE